MDCHDARERLWPPEHPRLLGESVASARDHVRRCPACADFFSQDRLLLDAYRRLRHEEMPGAVRDRLLGAVSATRSSLQADGTRSRALSRPAVAAASLLLAVAGWLLAMAVGGSSPESAGGPGGAEAAYLDDYLRRAVSRDRVETSDPGEIARFLGRELGIGLRPLSGAGVVPRSAEICLLGGRRGAVVEYEVDGRVVSHYLMPREAPRERPPALRSVAYAPGLPVVTWVRSSVEHALVGELDGERLLELARRVEPS